MKYHIPLTFFLVWPEGIWDTHYNYRDLPSKNFLINAYTLIEKNKLESIRRVRSKLGKLFVDSGGLVALKQKNMEWFTPINQEKYVKQTQCLTPDIICHLDVPIKTQLLSENDVSKEWALDRTISNAEKMLDIDLNNTRKCFAIQGWDDESYDFCIESYKELGVFSGEHVVAIAVDRHTRPPKLYELYSTMIKKIKRIRGNQDIHAFGIAQPRWLHVLYGYGVTSADSSSPFLAGVLRGDLIVGDGSRRSLLLKPIPHGAMKALTALNYWVYYMRLYKHFQQKKTVPKTYI